MKFLLFAFALVAAVSAEEKPETRIAVIDNFVANPGLDTAVDVGQWAAFHFAGFYQVYLLAFQWRDELSAYNTISEILSWDFFYAFLKYIEPAVTYIWYLVDDTGATTSYTGFFIRLTQWKMLYNTFCGSNCDFNREVEYDVFATLF